MMESQRARRPMVLALGLWLALVASIASWPLGGAGIGWPTAALAWLPLLAPLAGLARGAQRTFRWAPLTLAPALAITLTEALVNPAAQTRAAITLALALASFAAVIASLRSAEQD